jgi:hypothetical protein
MSFKEASASFLKKRSKKLFESQSRCSVWEIQTAWVVVQEGDAEPKSGWPVFQIGAAAQRLG